MIATLKREVFDPHRLKFGWLAAAVCFVNDWHALAAGFWIAAAGWALLQAFSWPDPLVHARFWRSFASWSAVLEVLPTPSVGPGRGERRLCAWGVFVWWWRGRLHVASYSDGAVIAERLAARAGLAGASP